jgi:hypothetical protein
MAKRPEALPALSLSQFAALEAWFEALCKAHLAPQGRFADKITAAYQLRQRALFLVTGERGPPATGHPDPNAEPDEEEFDDIC